jgi:hypothetical protein
MPACSGNLDIHVWSVTIDGVLDLQLDLLGSLIQRVTTFYSSLPHTHTHTHTSVHSHVFTSRYSVAASKGGSSPSSGFPNCPRASATSF